MATLETYIPKYQPPTENELKSKALRFVKENKPGEYRNMQKSVELDEYCRLKAEEARRYAEDLIASGEWDKQAWNRAIRLIILESESD
jgi:hypothetical protein